MIYFMDTVGSNQVSTAILTQCTSHRKVIALAGGPTASNAKKAARRASAEPLLIFRIYLKAQ